MPSQNITFYSKCYDIDILELFTLDRTDISLCVCEFWLGLRQHRFLYETDPRTTLILEHLSGLELYNAWSCGVKHNNTMTTIMHTASTLHIAACNVPLVNTIEKESRNHNDLVI